MGMSSSQARLLNLTARMHQIEYKAAKLEAMKLQMANESSRVYETYLEAIDKSKIQIKRLGKVLIWMKQKLLIYMILTKQ